MILAILVTERENDLGDSDITSMLEKLDPAEMARLEEYFKAKGGGGGAQSSSSAPAPPPPPAPAAPAMVKHPLNLVSPEF